MLTTFSARCQIKIDTCLKAPLHQLSSICISQEFNQKFKVNVSNSRNSSSPSEPFLSRFYFSPTRSKLSISFHSHHWIRLYAHIDFIPNPKALGEAVRRKNRLSIEKTHYYSIERRRGEGERGKRKFKSKKVTEIVLNSQLPPFHPISNTHITRSHTSAHTPSHSSLKVKFIDESTEMLTRAQVGSCWVC